MVIKDLTIGENSPRRQNSNTKMNISDFTFVGHQPCTCEQVEHLYLLHSLKEYYSHHQNPAPSEFHNLQQH